MINLRNPHFRLAFCQVSRVAQRGIALIIVLIALALMSLAAAGLIRSIDTGTLVVGNLAFKQGATSIADSSAEAAITWLAANNAGAALYTDVPAAGYYATSLASLDITGKSTSGTRVLIDWDNDNCAGVVAATSCFDPAPATSINSYTTQYFISRMCKTTGDQNATGNNCSKAVSTTDIEAPKKGELKYGEDKRFTAVAGPYYRIVVRSRGPKNTVSYTESYVHF